MKEQLTDVQKKIYGFVAGYIDDNGYCPTYNEVAERMNMSSQAVEAHLRTISKKGWLRNNGKKFRKYSLMD